MRDHDRLIRHMAKGFERLGVPLDDLMQEGRIALVCAARTWRHEAALWTYARRFVLAAMLRAASDALSSPSVEIDDASGHVDSLPAPGPDAESSVLLRQLLETLDDNERTVIVCCLGGGVTLADVASTLGISTVGAFNLRNVALAKMRDAS